MESDVLTHVDCYHCGSPCPDATILTSDKAFCCSGCLAVYQLLSGANLNAYYKRDKKVGRRPNSDPVDRFAYLDSPDICAKAFEYFDSKAARISLHIPQIHCPSCIWLLENLHILNAGILSSRASLSSRHVAIVFDHTATSLRTIVELLSRLGYEPNLSLAGIGTGRKRNPNWQLYAKLGVAGFAFSNVMLFSLPEYLATSGINDSSLSRTFRYASLLLALPVLIYSASDYFRSAWLGLRQKFINLDVPLALGISMLFLRSAYDILFGNGTGYLDSFTGLVFVLLVGKLFQRYTFEKLSFDKDYRSYFPISCLRREQDIEKLVHIDSLRSGDHVIVRNNEIIPADSFLVSGRACVDYSFVTGESVPQEINIGQRLFAGGRQVGSAIELEIVCEVSDSYLISLWGKDSLASKPNRNLHTMASTIAAPFTVIVLLIAVVTGVYWWMQDSTKAVHAVTSVLLVACPCALALAGPFVLGTTVRIFGENRFFLRNSEVVEELSTIDSIIFDKTGTLTIHNAFDVNSVNLHLLEKQKEEIASLARHSTHPLSRAISRSLPVQTYHQVSNFEEIPGAGVRGIVNGHEIRIGNAAWCGLATQEERIADDKISGAIFVSIAGIYFGYLQTSSKLRDTVPQLFKKLKQCFSLTILSGDTAKDESSMRAALGREISIHFNCSPHDKLKRVNELNAHDKRTLMLGDGLNDSGAIGAATVGISVTDDISSFTPACDGILDASKLNHLDRFLGMASRSRRVIIACYVFSFLYNCVGLAFAITGHLSPLVSAILMPVSSITVILFATSATRFAARKEGLL